MSKISIIIPLYNKGPHIARALNSVLGQTFQDFEVIVVDGHSSDNGAAVVKEFVDPRINLIQQYGKGVSQARNQGVTMAHGDLIAFLDADDEWTPIHLDTILRLNKKYPRSGIFATSFKIFKPDGRMIWNTYKCIPDWPWEGTLPNYFKSASVGDTPLQTSVVVIPKKIFLEVGGYPEDYWFGEDHDLFGKVALKYPVAFSWELGAMCHWDASNRASDKLLPLDYEEPFINTARNALKNGEVLPEFTWPLNEYLSKKEIPRAAKYVLAGNGKTAQNILKKCKTKYLFRKRIAWFVLAILPYSMLLYLQRQKRKVDMAKIRFINNNKVD